MAHKEVINISTVFSADIANVNNGIKTIRQNLDTLKLPSGLEKNFLNLLSKLDTEMSNFEAKTKDGLGSKLDSRALEKSGRNILELYRQLQVQVKSLGTLSNSEFKKMFPDSFGDNIAKSTKAISDYAKETKKTTGEIQKQSDALAELQKKQKNIESQAAILSKKKANTTDAAYNILSGQTKTARTSATKASNRELEAQRQIEVAKDSGAKVTKTGNLDARIPANRELIESLKQAQEEAKKTMTVYEDLRQKLSASIPPSQIDDEQQKIQNELNKTKSSIDEVKQTLSGLESLSASSFDELKATLSEITGLDFSNIKQGEEGFQQLANAINSIETGVIDALKGKIDQLENSTEGVAPAIENIKDGMEDAGKAVDDLTRREEDIGRLKAQILDFFSIGNAIQLFKRAVTSAFETVKDLDAAMTETAVVTEFSVGDMWSQLPQYTKRANELGVSIKGAYEAATLYYQQGLKTNQVIGVSNETLKMARIANIEAADATDLMTAALRGFNMEVNETSARNVSDVYSNLAAITAADTEEIGIAMSKTASIAESANMEFNTTAALLSQIIETTREAPETAGTAMKTIIARFTEVKKLISEGDLMGTDEEGEVIDVNKIDTALKTVGISLKGFLQGTEGIDDIFLKLASKWDTLDISTQRYIATMAAGSRQQSRFLAMMGDYDRTMELVGEANNSAGASQQQFEKTLKSMESKLAKLKNAWDEFVMGLANNDILKFGVDALTVLLNTVNSLLKTLSGGQPIIKTFLTGLLAVGAFKLGKSVLGIGKGGGVLGLILGTKAGQAKAGAEAGNTTGDGFIKGIGNKLKGSKDKTKNYFKEFFVSKGTVSEELKLAKEAADKKVQIAKEAVEQTEQVQIKAQQDVDAETVKNGYVMIGSEANQKLAAAKQQNTEATNNLKVAEGEQIKVQQEVDSAMSKTATNMQTVGVAATALGVGFNLLASLLDNLGADDSVVEFFSTLGMVLMAAGAVMPIVSSAFTAAGTQIAIAGVSAQIAWWWVFAIIAAVGVIIGLVVAASKAAKEASLAGQLEKAQKATEAAKDSADSAKEAYSDLLSAKEEYTGLQDTLENLTKGTNEWKQALIEANGQVLELLSTYPELAQYISRGDSGQLSISEAGWDAVIEEQQASLQRAQAAAVSSQMAETRIQGKMNERDLAKKFQIATDTQLANGYVVPPYDALQNAGYIEGTGSDEDIFYNQKLIEQLRALTESGELTDEALIPLIEENKRYGESAQETIARLRELTLAVNEYDSALLANQIQLESQAATLLTAGASQETLDSKYNDTVVSGFAKRMTTSDYAEEEEAKAEEYYQTSTTEDDTKREQLMKDRGIAVSGDEKKDVQALYASLAGLKSVEDISEDLKDDTEAMSQQIGKMLKAEDQIKNMEDFQKRLNNVGNEDIARNIAGLMSGDASQFTKGQLDKVGSLSDYASQLGYADADAEEMAAGLGYSTKTLSQLDREDQLANARKAVGIQGTMSDIDYQKALDDWISANGAVEISAEVQMNIDSNQYKAEMEEAYNKASAGLAAKGVTEGYDNLSIDTVKNLSTQVGSMSNEAAQNYVANFNKVLESSDLGGTSKKELETYLSTVDWTSMADAVKAMDYMQEMGLDQSIVESYWKTGVEGANAYVKSLAEATTLTERFQGQMNSASEIKERLSSGEGTTKDIEALEKAGVDLEGKLQLTANGWKMTEEAAAEATKVLELQIMQQADAAVKAHKDTMVEYEKMALNNATALGSNTSLIDGKATAKNDFDTLSSTDKSNIGADLGITRESGESDEQYWARARQAYLDYIDAINNSSITTDTLEQTADFTRAQSMTADQNRAAGGSEQSIAWSAQNQAKEQGLDTQELNDYAVHLQKTKDLAQGMATEIARENMVMNAAIVELNSNYEKWSNTLKAASVDPSIKDSQEYANTIKTMQKNMQDLTGVTDNLSEEFFLSAKNLKLMEKAAEGNTEAIKELKRIAVADIIMQMRLDPNAESEVISAVDSIINSAEYDDLEIGTSLDTTGFYDMLQGLLNSGAITVDQMNKILEGIGFEPEITTETITLSDEDVTNGFVEVPSGRDAYGAPTGTTRIPLKAHMAAGSSVSFPVINGKATVSRGAPKAAVNTSNKKPSGGGGGGGGGSKKKETWENPYDELYNLTEKVNESLRQREKIERDYDRLLKNRMSTSKQILANSLKEIAKLREEIALQKQLQAGRKKQISKLGSETFKDEEGNKKSFSAWGVTKYASYNETTGTITIDWEGIDKITDTEKGGAVEAYISKLEELSEQFEETQDTIEDMEDIIREIQERGKTEYIDFEQRIYDALVAKDQEVIDNLSEINDSINDSNARLLDSIQTAVDEQRRARERDEQRSDIEEKQRRLALLRSDTSGANALEIKKLEEEIGDLQQSYTDSLVDDSLTQLQKQNDDAAEQRERQIEIMQNQLDYAAKNGAYWEEVSNLLSTAFNPDGSLNNNSALIDLLKETEGFKALSEFGGMQWIDELIESWLVAQEGLANWKVEKAKQSTTGVKTQNAGTLKYNSSTGLWSDTSGGTYSTLAYDPATGQYKASGYTPKTSTPAPTPTSGSANPYGKASATSGNIKSGAKGNAVKAIQYALNKLNYGNSGTKSVDGIFGSGTVSAVKAFQKAMGISADGIVGNKTREKFKVKGYLKGGLADYTGPAWMDGTPSKPELVLDAKDTQNFIVLKNILADVFEGRNGISEKSGDNYFEVHIEVDKLENDYDVEQVAEKVKRIVNEDARYRNVNAINLLR